MIDTDQLMFKVATAEACRLGVPTALSALRVAEVFGAMAMARTELEKAAQGRLVPAAAVEDQARRKWRRAQQRQARQRAGQPEPLSTVAAARGAAGIGTGALAMLAINALSPNRRMGDSLLPAMAVGGVAGLGSGILGPMLEPAFDFS